MLQDLTSTEVTELLAYGNIECGLFEETMKEENKRKNAAKNLRQSLAHKVKKHGG